MDADASGPALDALASVWRPSNAYTPLGKCKGSMEWMTWRSGYDGWLGSSPTTPAVCIADSGWPTCNPGPP
eukprot:689151-Lingulodinium_polyedra.AAC.1